MRLEDLGLVGNCQYSALIENTGAVVWCCLPRFDAEPVFATLLDEAEGGSMIVAPAEGGRGQQRYLENSNVLETRFDTPSGSFRILDFAPRFLLYERFFRPTKLVRIVEPLQGSPRIIVRCQPRLGWSKGIPTETHGSHHIRYYGFAAQLRMTTDCSLSYVNEQPFALTEKRHIVLSWGDPVEEPLPQLCERFLNATLRYWQGWVKHCSIPPLWQKEVIRSALALKLHCFEDTGAIVAAMTTSLPEAAGSGRTWDYRYCWLRDAYYAISAFHLLGHFEEREQFMQFLLNIAGSAPGLDLAPLYCIDGSLRSDERILPAWPGYEGNGPVRIGNAAAGHQQHDVFGEMVLALSPIYLDERFAAERSEATLRLLLGLARKAIRVVGTPDAGIWEYRSEWRPQTFSSLMCWAACDRMAKVAAQHRPQDEAEFRRAAETIREQILARGYRAKLGSLVASYSGKHLDASLLQAITLRLLPASDPRMLSSVQTIQKSLALAESVWLRRYNSDDGFGVPSNAFVICTFWLIEALARVGRIDEARATLGQVLRASSPLGLLSEDLDVATGRLWGNFPQAYSHVGLIHAAFAASPCWAELL
ncbi:MAG TPA: glycoside hydrolase family 15 protein [Pseudomonadota bacterium]|nr:glycoside hydrolase family 15 protein [Pseudomonadota bacterium]